MWLLLLLRLFFSAFSSRKHWRQQNNQLSYTKQEVTDYIINKLKHGVTRIEGTGAFTNEKKDLLLTVIPTNEYYRLKVGLKKIDSKAFFVVSDSYEVGGGE